MTLDVPRPLKGLRVIEFTHMLMGPAVGAIMADMGADVIRVEPPGGDKTRWLPGSGAGYFLMFNRNKKSICIDLKSTDGRQIAIDLTKSADVVVENFRPGTMKRLGLGYDDLVNQNPRLIYCSQKGFLGGPYEHRAALDEVAQMMGGLAYMTGPPGRPLRAGASVIDIMGGMFGVIGIMAAIEERHRTGRGQEIKSALYEDVVYLMGQHMAQQAITGQPVPPMPARVSAWAIYDVFTTGDDERIFVGVVSDAQWKQFCRTFELHRLLEDSDMSDNTGRVAKRDTIIPVVRAVFSNYTKAELMTKLETIGVPFAPITKPQELETDPHLSASNGLLDIELPTGGYTRLPNLPLEMGGKRFDLQCQPPRPGEHTEAILADLNYPSAQIDDWLDNGTVSTNV